MALYLHKALPNLSKLERIDGTNYRRWSQKLLIFLEQLEVNCVLFSCHTEENNTSEITVASSDGTEKSKIASDETRRKFEKYNKRLGGIY